MTLNHARILSSETFTTAAANTNSAAATVNLHIEPSQEEIKVKYDSPSPYADLPDSTSEEVLKLILNAYVNNPLIVKNLVVMKTEKLLELIRLMTHADSVELEANTDVSCCGKPTSYNHIGGIVIVKSGLRSDFKIAYNDCYRLLKDYKISLKLTTD